MSAHESNPQQDARPLAERILDTLQRKPGQKAAELARALGADRKEVNRCLSHTLAGKVVQDAAYRWSVRAAAKEAGAGGAAGRAPLSELGRLARYYLECIGQDSDKGVSVFAASRYGEPDYAELPALPLATAGWDWWNSPGVERVLSKVKADRNKLIAWMGYPVRLREHRTPKWHGYFVEPVMLWQVELPENPGDPYRFVDDVPVPNFSVLRSVAMGDPAAVVEEAARLDEELGLNNVLEDRPEVDELIERLVNIRPDWDWREAIDPERCTQDAPLAEIDRAGIYNRAVILPGERSPYTQGLETELKQLSEKGDEALAGTALGRWLSGDTGGGEGRGADAGEAQPLIEVLPMNSEQRAAVQSALTAVHTVVTGPPGTGKSQVVTNLLVNAAWRGMKVLFASKNNKAVDVVEARVNGLGNRPVLLRLGSKEYQAKLASYLGAMLSGHVSEDDRVSYEEGLTRHRQLAEKLAHLEHLQSRTLAIRNEVDRMEADVEHLRELLGETRFNDLDEGFLGGAAPVLRGAEAAADALDPAKQGLFGKLALRLGRKGREAALRAQLAKLGVLSQYLGAPGMSIDGEVDTARVRGWLGTVQERVAAAGKVLAYQRALETLRASPPFEEIARQRQELTEQIAENSTRLWRDWVQMAPSRLAPAERKDVADYTALLQIITASDGESVNASVRGKARELQAKVSKLFSCWAVTSLSARGKVPFEPGYFDLVVIDEASQCDIASALPLLYRAKRSVIIGDPMQLRHISAVSRSKDADLQSKYGLVENRAAWMYSVSSLYDLAAGVADSGQVINLRDHHRCHADIIEFSNRQFYAGKLRVATRYHQLKRPRKGGPGVVWQDVKGWTIQPASGGAQNAPEAKALVEALHDLLVTRGYVGTVGVVTPFRAQVQLIQSMLAESPALAEVAAGRELLVDTVHRFQGDERDVMFFSPVVSDGFPAGALGFLRSNGNLFNVAITRARGLLHVVGDRAAAADCGVDYLSAFARYVESVGQGQTGGEPEALQRLGPDYPPVSRPERVSDWERVLYRAMFAAGIRAIPQYSVDQYDLDFALIVGNRRLNIEVDGERYHRSWTGELCLRDQLRNQRLIELGWEVKRFWVYEVRDRLPECVAWIAGWAKQAAEGQMAGTEREYGMETASE
ncbi:MAG: AAA domain-containing protein [Methyloversatilis sp.]|jgi:very-short-patch-repair endonuclease|nr:AAA domain-containing protein [Methyloversatilis sp.]